MTSSVNAEPKGSEPSSTDPCACGHLRSNHGYGPRCIGNRNLCACLGFRAPERSIYGCFGNASCLCVPAECRCETPKSCTCGPDEACGDLCDYEPRCEGCGHTEGEGCGCPPRCTCGCLRSAHMGKPQGCIPHGFHEYEEAPEPPMTPEEEEQAPKDPGRCPTCDTTEVCRKCGACTPGAGLCDDCTADEAAELAQESLKDDWSPPQPDMRPPLLVAYSVQGHLYEVALPGDAVVRAVDGALVITHPLGPVAGIVQVAPVPSKEQG